jgi:hypothetical protein
MAVVELQDCNWEESGCARRSFFVCFWYDFMAAWKITWKREASAVVDIWDITPQDSAAGVTTLVMTMVSWSSYAEEKLSDLHVRAEGGNENSNCELY